LRFTIKGLIASGVPDFRSECRSLLDCLGFELEIEGSLPDGPCLIVANHLSYLDIVILCTLRPAIFVTSFEVRDQPATGFFARLGRSIFVERRNYSTLLKDIGAIKDALRVGHTVGLFPEGTTSSGKMLPWKSSLLEAASALSVPVLPVALEYLEVNRKKICYSNHDLLYYYGSMSFNSHLPRLLQEVDQAKVKVTVLSPIVGTNRKKITDSARLAVLEVLLDRIPT